MEHGCHEEDHWQGNIRLHILSAGRIIVELALLHLKQEKNITCQTELSAGTL